MPKPRVMSSCVVGIDARGFVPCAQSVLMSLPMVASERYDV